MVSTALPSEERGFHNRVVTEKQPDGKEVLFIEIGVSNINLTI
jgi:hypothetical protein